ncbi:hypothetical protein N0V90_004563 [Kalmusia sp. IMI 367209]|nr:hypothetical protein N0V90_004563 [Kalmusia sp. IMI 367209]
MLPTPRSFISRVAPAVLALIGLAEGKGISELLYQYNEPTWIENLAVRGNGLILPATATSAVLTELSLVDGHARTVANESGVGNAIMGITEVLPDLFAMNTMYCNLTTLSVGIYGTGITWSVDLCKKSPIIRKLAQGPSPTSVLNGMAALNEKTILIVDQALGGVWAIDLYSGSINLVIQDDSMADPSNQANGVNGIRVRLGVLYYNNPALGTFARIPIDPRTGKKTGEAEVIASGLEPDDFEIDDRKSVAYLTNGAANTLVKIDLKTGHYDVIVEDLPGPTTARWIDPDGAQNEALYVATTGGYPQWLEGNPTVGGAIYKVTLEDCFT